MQLADAVWILKYDPVMILCNTISSGKFTDSNLQTLVC